MQFGTASQPDGKAKIQEAAKKGELRPNLMKRGAIRSVFDGRYQFTRYFSPKQHNWPNSTEALFKLNDVELFDLEVDRMRSKTWRSIERSPKTFLRQ